jgi:hypothetical protein
MSFKEAKKKSKIYIRDSHRMVTDLHCKANNNKKIAIEETRKNIDSLVYTTKLGHTLYDQKRKLPNGRFVKWMNSNAWQYYGRWGVSFDEWRRIELLVATLDSINKSK